MGFCHRCGEITSGKCSKCGGRSVASTISSIVSEGGISVIDRWQSQYADTILAPEEITTKPNVSPTVKRIPVTQSTFYNPPPSPTTNTKKVCTCCSKPIVSTSFIEEELSYCKECHLKLFNKGQCPTCQKPVSERDTWIEYSTSIWHADCFTCFSCKVPLESNPLIDLKNRPCCEPCFMTQGASRTKKVSLPPTPTTPSPTQYNSDSYSSQSSTSTTGSNSSTSQLYLNQSRYSRRPRIDRDLFQPAVVTPPRTPSPADDTDLLAKRRSTFIPPQASTSSPSDKRRSTFIPPASTSSPIHEKPAVIPQPTQSSTSLSQRPCHYCHKPLGDATQKKTKIPIQDGLYAWFHKSCFLCSKCHLPFKNSECATDGHSFYHPKCDTVSSCFGCKKDICQDAFQFNDKMYHFSCFRCYGNGCTISIGQPVFEVGKRPYCQPCYDLSLQVQQQQPVQQKPVQQQPQATKSRQRVLPKLGGSKTCPRCRSSISIMEDTPGPLASRWHKKCLCCAGCSKQLDSAAKMRPGQHGESLVYCRSCF